MSTLAFGFTPVAGRMSLSRYSDFANVMVSSTGSWPDGSGVEFRFMANNLTVWMVWPATISGAEASWLVSADDVAALLDSGVSEYRLFYVCADNALEWSKGPVVDVT